MTQIKLAIHRFLMVLFFLFFFSLAHSIQEGWEGAQARKCVSDSQLCLG